MVEEVVWVKRAIVKFNNIVSYLRTEWSDKLAEEFHDRTYIIIDLIRNFPEIGRQIKQRKNS